MTKLMDCDEHGRRPFESVCTHVAHAIGSGQKVGFYWGDDTDLARPDAWCAKYEAKLVALNDKPGDQWFADADFKMLCIHCWDSAKETVA